MKLLHRSVFIATFALGVVLPAKTYQLVDLGRPPVGTADVSLLGDPKINNAGTIALAATAPQDATRAFAYRDGAYTEIPNPLGWRITVEGINDYDDIVGGFYLADMDEETLVFRDGYRYNAASADFQLVSAITGFENMSPRCINNSGTLLLASDFDDLAVVYDAGMVFQLGDVDPSFQYAVGRELNNAGQLLFSPDFAYPSPGVPDVWASNQFLYTLGDPAAEALPEGTPWTPEWIQFARVNDQGVVAGGSEVALVLYQGGELLTVDAANVAVAEINNSGAVVGMYGPWDARRPFIYDGRAFKDVNSLACRGGFGGWTIISASGVNDLGQIVGLMRNGAGETHVFLLNPAGSQKSALGELTSLLSGLLASLGSLSLF